MDKTDSAADPEWEAEKKRITDTVDRAVEQIGEFVDSCQVFVTLHRDDNKHTMSYERGAGNFYTRQGQVDEWLTMQRQYQRNEAIRRDKNREDE